MSLHRIDIPSKHTHGWQARVKLRGGDGAYLSQFFSDLKCRNGRSFWRACDAHVIMERFARSMGC